MTQTKPLAAALFAALLAAPAMALNGDDCTQLAIAIGGTRPGIGPLPR